MEGNTVRIMLDIWAGPIWGCTYDEKNNTYDYKYDFLTKDKKLMNLHQQIQDLYSFYYHFNHGDSPVYFDKDQERKDKDKMLDLLNQLNKRLDELNDDSFMVDDRETERVRNL